MRQDNAASNSGSVVYVIGNADNRLVKIGTTTASADKRLSGIQTMSPSLLSVLWTTPGGRELEQELHRRFAAERRHGEWFDFGDRDPVTEVSAVARELSGPPPAPAPPAEQDPDDEVTDADREAGRALREWLRRRPRASVGTGPGRSGVTAG